MQTARRDHGHRQGVWPTLFYLGRSGYRSRVKPEAYSLIVCVGLSEFEAESFYRRPFAGDTGVGGGIRRNRTYVRVVRSEQVLDVGVSSVLLKYIHTANNAIKCGEESLF